ncbi:hypothetical protein FXO38_29906 [Capsicum annuum]|nr:hypothetical protein FXO38_29906 [Capsicum annuum]
MAHHDSTQIQNCPFSSVSARFPPRHAKVSSHERRGNVMAPRHAIPQFPNCQFPVTRLDPNSAIMAYQRCYLIHVMFSIEPYGLSMHVFALFSILCSIQDKECILARNPENSFRPTPATVVHDPTLPITKKYPSIRSAERNDWRNNDYTGKNEHLLESGQLGICNDPYCTTCLTYCYLKARQKISMSSDIFDHKGNSPKVGIQGKKWNSELPKSSKGSNFAAIVPSIGSWEIILMF